MSEQQPPDQTAAGGSQPPGAWAQVPREPTGAGTPPAASAPAAPQAPAGAALVLVKASELHGLPVVSITEGEALADVKDVVYSPDEGRLLGFTLNKRGGIFSGPLKAGLGIRAVAAIGRAAVMVHDASALDVHPEEGHGAQNNVLHNQVLTESGERLGEVSDLVVEVGVVADRSTSARAAAAGDVVGYEITADPGLQGRGGGSGQEANPMFIPLPYTLAVSGENLVVPATVESYIRDDLSGFGGAVNEFRAQLGPERGDAQGGGASGQP